MPSKCGDFNDVLAIAECVKLVLVFKELLKDLLKIVTTPRETVLPIEGVSIANTPEKKGSSSSSRGQKRLYSDSEDTGQSEEKQSVAEGNYKVIQQMALVRNCCTLKWASSDTFGSVVLKISRNLERELRAHVMLLRSPHKSIVPLLDYFVDSYNRQVLVFPAYPGELPTYKTLSLASIAHALKHLLEGLQLVHKLGIKHMDINPANLMWDPSSSQLAITDFGLAVVGGLPTFLGGTDGYKAPEVLDYIEEKGVIEDVTSSVDVFGAGVVLGKLLSHHVPSLNIMGEVTNTRVLEQAACTALRGSKNPLLQDALDLLTKMVAVSPLTRISCTKALEHPFFQYII